MSQYRVSFTKLAWKDAGRSKEDGPKPNAEILLDIFAKDSFQSPLRDETFVGNLSGTFLRRIDIQHRLVYQVLEQERVVKVIRMRSPLRVTRGPVDNGSEYNFARRADRSPNRYGTILDGIKNRTDSAASRRTVTDGSSKPGNNAFGLTAGTVAYYLVRLIVGRREDVTRNQWSVDPEKESTVEALIITVVAGVALLASLIADQGKTGRALRIAGKRFFDLLPAFLTMLAAVSIVLALVPQEMIVRYLGSDNRFLATLAGALIGAVTFMPGFIGFPLAGILLEQGVAYMTLSAFTTSLMIVGILTYPIEKRYLGTRVTVIRNSLSFVVAILVAAATGLYFGELP